MEAVIFWLTPLSATLPGSNATLLFLDQDQSSMSEPMSSLACRSTSCCGLPFLSFLSSLLFFFCRSTSCVVAYLMLKLDWGALRALNHIREKRPIQVMVMVMVMVMVTILSSLCEAKHRFCIIFYKHIFPVFNVTKGAFY